MAVALRWAPVALVVLAAEPVVVVADLSLKMKLVVSQVICFYLFSVENFSEENLEECRLRILELQQE